MKAIILAGGEGVRLRPLTDNIPKPMLDVAGRPALEHVIALLRRHGVTDAMIALRYMPESVINHFRITPEGSVWNTEHGDIRLHCRVERAQRGTAGAVADCAYFTGDEDFIVISGDCVCDFDLSALMDFHRERNARITLALYECAEPTEFGLVLTDPDGRVRGFTEKPEWERVLTDRVNTGIYALSRRALEYMPSAGEVDFAKDVFPAILAGSGDLYAVPLAGYWRDIGTIDSYNAANDDADAGKINLGAPPCGNRRSARNGQVFNITFASRGNVTGTPGTHFPYEAILRLGQACAGYRSVGFGYSGADLARTVTDILAGGANAYGADAVMFDAPVLSAAAFAARLYALPLTAFVTQRGESVHIVFIDPRGTPISHDDERKIAAASCCPRPRSSPGAKTLALGIREAYIAWLREAGGYNMLNTPDGIECAGGGDAARILRSVLNLPNPAFYEKPDECADTGGTGLASFAPGADGTTLIAKTETGRVLDYEHTLLLGAYISLREGARELTLPYHVPERALRLAESFGRRAKRSDTDAETWSRDGILLAAKIAAYITEHGVSLDALSLSAPDFASVAREITVRGGRAAAMRELTHAFGMETAGELGIELRPGGGVARVYPDRAVDALRIRVEAADTRAAETIAADVERRIRALDI